MENNSVFYSWRNPQITKTFRSGVSLHSHTNRSRETLKFLALLGSRYGLMRQLMSRLEQRAQVNHGMQVDYGLSYWTPPADPRLAIDIESAQIEGLGLTPMVSLTDHDGIEACLSSEAASAIFIVPFPSSGRFLLEAKHFTSEYTIFQAGEAPNGCRYLPPLPSIQVAGS